MSLISFLRVATHDVWVGAVMPSSSFAVRRILKRLPQEVDTVLEYGPGDGVLTRELLRLMSPEGRMIAIERNDEFYRQLQETNDPRLTVIQGDAREAASHAADHGHDGFDLIVSGIPFSLFSREERDVAVAMTHDLLKPGGTFLVYQTSPLMLSHLKKRFVVDTVFEPLNVPPYFIMRARRTTLGKCG